MKELQLLDIIQGADISTNDEMNLAELRVQYEAMPEMPYNHFATTEEWIDYMFKRSMLHFSIQDLEAKINVTDDVTLSDA